MLLQYNNNNETEGALIVTITVSQALFNKVRARQTFSVIIKCGPIY